MSNRVVAAAVALAGLLAATAPALAECTDEQVAAKVQELGNLMVPLSSRNPAEMQKITEEMVNLVTQPASDAICAAYDQLIVRAKR